jgi:putative hydrolase of the HAD superfamily
MTVRAVCFDAADTLFTERIGRAALYCEVFEQFGTSVDAVSMATWMGLAHQALPERVDDEPRYSDAWFRAFVREILRHAGQFRDPEPLRAALSDAFSRSENYLVYGDTFATLDDLTVAGFRLALVSNWSHRLPRLLEQLGLAHYFEVLAVSAVVGIDKPSAGLFHHALDRLGLTPGEALHVGNDPHLDGQAAQDAGLHSLHLDRSEAGSGPRGPRGSVQVIHSLTDVLVHLHVDRPAGPRTGAGQSSS